MLGHVPWGDERGGGRWITQHGGEFRALPTDFSISSGPDNHSPTHGPAEPMDTHPTPPQTQIHLLHLTSTPKKSSDLLFVGLFCSLGALLVLSQGRCPLPPTHPGSCTPNYPFSLYFHTLHSLVVLVVLVEGGCHGNSLFLFLLVLQDFFPRNRSVNVPPFLAHPLKQQLLGIFEECKICQARGLLTVVDIEIISTSNSYALQLLSKAA